VPARYGIRPEHLHLSEDGMPIEVLVVEPTGSETFVFAQAGDVPITCVFRERVTARPGEFIRVSPEPGRAHLFDAASGMRIN
ncbi:MAG: TOBE domain-containing protein, partial [Rhizobiaceae bacterium]|nr:TOBE domain-containing protein [Rhizobiaceae bacterium]